VPLEQPEWQLSAAAEQQQQQQQQRSELCGQLQG
jgi:hypothetical protein